MPWQECSVMSMREEFVSLASSEGANVRALCRAFGVSAKTGYKWLRRHRESGAVGLADLSRRPLRSPRETPAAMRALIVALRCAHPAWGGRKLKRRLEDLGHADVPAASTITGILRRAGLLTGPGSNGSQAVRRFEHAAPNDLWQMDFKGHFGVTRGGRCHPLTVLDDHSRYAIGLRACVDERGETVRSELTELFRTYGMPRRMLMDNGSPWGDAEGQPWTKLTVWLLRVGVGISHGRAGHPQTQGKDERFHRTLKAELLRERSFCDTADCQRWFDPWRMVYNTERPHEALALATPASRYRLSARAFPEVLPAVEYAPGTQVRKVQQGNGVVRFQGRDVRVGKAFCGEFVGLRSADVEGEYTVHYCEHCLGRIDLKEPGAGGRAILAIRRAPHNDDEAVRG